MTCPEHIFAGGGGFGDAVFILNKYRQFSTADSRLIFVTEQPTAVQMAGEFFKSQREEVEIRLVPKNDDAIREFKRQHAKILNTCWAGYPLLMPWLLTTYPFDAMLKPGMEFRYNPFSFDRPYFVVQTNAGTIKYGPGKNWLNVDWINQFIQQCRDQGYACVLAGTENPGIVGADESRLCMKMEDLLGLIHGAQFVLGLQGFISIVALMMGKRVLLKRENFLVVAHHVHPAWRRHLHLFGEPVQPSEKWIRWLLAKGLNAMPVRSK